ncbi:DUF2304 domain-containing protein [Tropheryma whipplei]|nr:DUF2304 domain-containing protein [Tropheryma whipplei]MCO8182847.1 DUF2304 domain-containing protein [Tropheryma whipplei]MCO8190591.1 DUF2304 domain-containing protein [Tropheryma whipplei]CAD66731.1 putative integral membrane protein [Tropheryma whipplei TW08/27]
MTSYFFGILVSIALLVILIEMLRREKLRERHAVWWLLAGFIAVFFAVFPGILRWISNLLGIITPINLVLFMAVILLFLVCLQQSCELAKLDKRTRRLAEDTLLLQDELEDIKSHSSKE